MRDNPNAPQDGICYTDDEGLASFISLEERAEYAEVLPTFTKQQLRSHYSTHNAQSGIYARAAYNTRSEAERERLIIKSRREAELEAMAEQEMIRRRMKV